MFHSSGVLKKRQGLKCSILIKEALNNAAIPPNYQQSLFSKNIYEKGELLSCFISIIRYIYRIKKR
jgi:hypothetical protein